MNKRGRTVRYRVPPSSRKGDGDHRVRMTTEALVFAMVELTCHRGWDAVTVHALTAIAGVSRSTFYAHYRDKDDLLFRSFEALLVMLDQSMALGGVRSASATRVAPVRELFEHMRAHRAFHDALVDANVIERQFQAGVEVLTRTIERRFVTRRTVTRSGENAMPLSVRSRALAGALFALLRWWLDEDKPHSPEQMDAMFHALADGPRA